MGVGFSLTTAGVLMVFYLVLLIFQRYVKRPPFFLLGSGGVALTLLMGFLHPWLPSPWAKAIVGIFTTIGTLIAFSCAFLAVYVGKLPVDIPGMEAEEEKTPAEETAGQ